MGLEALGAIAGGINKGMDWTRRDREIDDQRALREEQQQAWRQDRDFAQGQRTRALSEQQKADNLKLQSSLLTPPGQEYDANTGQGPTKKTQTEISLARQQANLEQAAGNTSEARKLWSWADDAAAKSAADRALGVLRSMPGTASAYDIAKAVAPGVDADESPIGVDPQSIRKNDNDGSVTMKLLNKKTGYSEERTFKDPEAIRQALVYHYAPDYARKLDEERTKAQAEIAKKRADGVKLGPGEEQYSYTSDGRLVRTAASSVESPTIAAARIRAAGGGATGAGATSSKTSKSQQAYDVLKDLAKADEDKPFLVKAQANVDLIEQLNAKDVPAGIIANAALQYARDPAAATTTFDPATGRWGKAFNFEGRRVLVNDRVDPAEIEKAIPTQADALYTTLKAQNSPLIAAASNPAELSRVASTEVNKIASDLAKATGRNAVDADVQAQARAVFESQGRPKIDATIGLLSKSEALKKASEKPAPSIGSRLGSVGGIFGRTQKTGQQASYDEYVKAKSDRDALMSTVSKMSPDRREVYLSSRLPEIEARIKQHENYLSR